MGIDIDVDMDIDSVIAVSVRWGSFKKALVARAPLHGLRADIGQV